MNSIMVVRMGLLLALGVSALLPGLRAASLPAELERYEYRRVVFGVEGRLVLYATDEKTATAAAEGAWRRLEELDAVFSDWRVDSELSLLRRAPVGIPVPISEDLSTALAQAGRMYVATEGAYDATVGPYVKLWREARELGRLPNPVALAAAATSVGWDKLELLPGLEAEGGGGYIVFNAPGMALDLGGVAKGIGAQQALGAMKRLGVNRALVELGGDLAAGDPPPDREAWETLAGCGSGRTARVTLVNECLAVSGDTEQSLAVDGIRYSHVIDPRTGQAVTRRTCATILARDGATADALASAVQVLGSHDGRRVVEDVVGARVLMAEPLDLPVARQFRDPLRLAPRLEADLGEGGAWGEDGDALVGRLAGDGSSMATFPGGTNWSLEMSVSGDQRLDLVVHPDAAQPGKHALRLPVEAGGDTHWEVRCSGFDRRLRVWRDGDLVRDAELATVEGELDGDRRVGLSLEASGAGGVAPRGAREADGERVVSAATPRGPAGTVRVAGLQLRRLDSVDEGALGAGASGKLVLTEDAEQAGWRPLIEVGLPQWEVETGNYSQSPRDYLVLNGVLHVPADGSGQLRTRKDFSDFRLRMEFKLAPGANSGLFLRADREGGDPAYSGCEIQIIDDHGWEELAGFALKPKQQCGSLYAAVAADAPGALRPTGEWNTYEVLYEGSRLAVALNGRVLYDVDTLELDCDPPFSERATSGFIGLQRYGAPHVPGDTALWVRNMFVREVEPSERAAAGAGERAEVGNDAEDDSGPMEGDSER